MSLKDVSIRVRGADRPTLDEIQKQWPVTQADILAAALRRFKQTPAEQQGEDIRAVSIKPRRHGRRERQTA